MMEIVRLKKTDISHMNRSLPLYGCRISAGFPSPGDDFIERSLDLNEYLVRRPSSTWFARAQGDALRDAGILDGDLLIVDRAAGRVQGAVVVAAIDGELTCRILDLRNRRLLAANPDYQPIDIGGREDAMIEGVVVFSVRSHHARTG